VENSIDFGSADHINLIDKHTQRPAGLKRTGSQSSPGLYGSANAPPGICAA